MAALTLTDIAKTYAGGAQAVRGVSLAVPEGAFCVLVGPSGCGKSTLLRMIAGLETITAGEVRIADRVVNALEPAERDIAMVFQNYALYPHMSVYDNMAYGLKNRRTPKAEIETRVREAARILGLGELLTRRPRELSGGQRQRVAMGRAIVRKPQVFLFDEPLSNLDAKLRVQMRVEIKRLQRQIGVTSIYVTHDQVEAMTLSDVLVVMNAGEVEQVGSPLDVYRRPASRFVAGFIGSPGMNFLVGEIVGPDQVAVGEQILTLGESARGWPVGAGVDVGIRPEEMRIVPDGTPGLPFTPDVIEELGATQLVHGRIGGSAPATIQLSTHIPDAAKTLTLAVAPGSIHLFDRATGKRLVAAS